MKLFTVGYEGQSIEDFVAFLKQSGVRQIADVRKNPVSRKKGFSKNRLAEALAKAGIAYAHFPGLGVPREWRNRAKDKTITREKMFRDYEKKILPLETDALKEVAHLAKEKPTALLCFEADAHDCHRHEVSEALKKKSRGLKVVDLAVEAPEPDPKSPRLFARSVTRGKKKTSS